jgi:ribosomal protein S18 acetylase RimI-like enzyme
VTPAYEVVPTEERHIEAFYATVDEVARERRYLAMTEAPPLEDMRKFVKANLAAGAPHFVALAGTELVGWCDTWIRPQAGWQHSGVLGMGVLRSHRGRGIGASLLEATLQRAKERGLTRIELAVRVDNVAAKKLYDRFGFSVEGICRRHQRIDGQYFDSYLMALLF